MNLSTAQRYAEKIVEWLGPFCFRMEIAGSVRRRRTECNDIDLVCIPKLEEQRDLLGASVGMPKNLLREELIRYVKGSMAPSEARWQSGTEPKADASNLMLILPKCQLDVFCANASNFASRYLCRTGSKEHNIWLCERAAARGGHWNPQDGLVLNGRRIEAETEADIYEALELKWIKPEERELEKLQRMARTKTQ